MVRAAVVVTADQTLAVFSRTFHVVPVTSNVERSWTTDVPLDAAELERNSVAQCHLCTVVDELQIVDPFVGSIGSVQLAQIRSVLADLLDLP